MSRYSLKLTALSFISPVDDPAQRTATARLIKRAGQADIKAVARAVKFSDELGLVFGWALTSKSEGADYFDAHGDNIVEDDLIRVAADYMESSGLSDEMHDRSPDGRVLFMMPMTAEVAKAFGIESSTTGLMIAMKPSADVFQKFKSGEYTGFSIDGEGLREAVKSVKKSRVVKAELYTDEVDGHQHVITMYEDGTFSTSWATSAGAEYGHSHAVTTDENGLVILADSGHTHVLAEGQAPVIVVPQDAIVVGPEDVVVVVQNAAPRKRAPKSSPAPEVAKVDFNMKPIVLTEAQFAHYSKLASAEAEAFIAKSHDERDTILQKAVDADPIVVEFNGQAFRKSASPQVIELAKAAKAQAEQFAKQAEAIEKAEVRKTAVDTIGKLGGGDEVHDLIIKSLRKSGAPAEQIEAALTAMKGWNSLAEKRSTAPGAGGTEPANSSPYVELTTGLETFCKSAGIATGSMWSVGLDRFKATPEGAALKRAYDASLTAG